MVAIFVHIFCKFHEVLHTILKQENIVLKFKQRHSVLLLEVQVFFTISKEKKGFCKYINSFEFSPQNLIPVVWRLFLVHEV